MRIKPDYNLKSIYDINLDELMQKGIKLIVFDLDSTLMISKSANFLPETIEWLNKVKEMFSIVILSNNYNEKYLDKARAVVDIDIIGAARKPDTRVLLEYLSDKKISTSEIAIVGDRPLTDILCGKRLGCITVLVDSINAEVENKPTRFVRILERLIIRK